GQKRRENRVLRSLSRNAYSNKKKTGVKPQKGDHDEQKRKIPSLSIAGEKGHPGASVSGRRKPQSHRVHRECHRLLSGLSQRQQRRIVSSYLGSVLPGRQAESV